jgi:hypothetical protein
MARYTATVRLLDLEAIDPQAARKQLEEKLVAGRVGRYQVLVLEAEPSPLPVRQLPPTRPKWFETAFGPMLLFGALAWTLWFYWLLFG